MLRGNVFLYEYFIFRLVFIVDLLVVAASGGTMLRLECRLHGNFSVREKGKRYNQAALETHYKITNTLHYAMLCF